MDPNISHKKLYAKEIVENLDYIKDQDIMLSNLMDPRFFIIHNRLSDDSLSICNFSIRLPK